jgi:hypothetical protein
VSSPSQTTSFSPGAGIANPKTPDSGGTDASGATSVRSAGAQSPRPAGWSSPHGRHASCTSSPSLVGYHSQQLLVNGRRARRRQLGHGLGLRRPGGSRYRVCRAGRARLRCGSRRDRLGPRARRARCRIGKCHRVTSCATTNVAIDSLRLLGCIALLAAVAARPAARGQGCPDPSRPTPVGPRHLTRLSRHSTSANQRKPAPVTWTALARGDPLQRCRRQG